MNVQKKEKIQKVSGVILFISLAASVLYSIVRICIAPSVPVDGEIFRLKSDYVLMLVQCILGLIVMFLPTLISRKMKIVVPNTIVILYYVFLYCAIFLGEVRNFYYTVPHWDTMLHAFSGAMLGALGFVLVDILNRDTKIPMTLSPFFVSLFAFCFALAVGALWEIYEFSFDAVLGLNMQKHSTEAGVPLLGAEALGDTMKDIIIDALSALAVTAIGYFTAKGHIFMEKKKEK